MRRSLQEVVELVVFGLVALLIGTGLLWLVGWILSLGGLLLKAIAGLLWLLLRFVVPVAIVAGLVYFIVKALQDRESGKAGVAPASSGQSAASTTAGSTAATTARSKAPATGAPVAGTAAAGTPAPAAPVATPPVDSTSAAATPGEDDPSQPEPATPDAADPEAPDAASEPGDESAEDDA